ncbi:hypothetical protein OIU34_23865 [Pararhizobium sp. BT-229]|uniref:hypothetical protein n=1 Tax=Pararhizobium sp. BT-229 TaxID=2986923 RepID=UPI0021F6B089|nr:hypothetical protein [Pararhizobium sp. BT-229]MCV9964935.1 hypothetical protein [Pararhizobium sp. BT-229]
MGDLRQALAATKYGYEAEGKSMHDEDMIDHAETITAAHDEIITALAKAAVLDKIVKLATEKELVIDANFAASLSVSVGKEVGLILKHELETRPTVSASSAPRI